jgi:hypothetical protein
MGLSRTQCANVAQASPGDCGDPKASHVIPGPARTEQSEVSNTHRAVHSGWASLEGEGSVVVQYGSFEGICVRLKIPKG